MSNGATTEPFAPVRHDLVDLELGPLDDDVATIAGRLAGIDPWARIGRSAAAFEIAMTRPSPGAHRFALRCKGAPVGYLALRWPFMRGPYIETIAVFPEMQGRGLASRIVTWMENQVADEASNIWLCVTEWNTGARAAYAALGFVEIGPIPDLVASGQSEIFMRRAFAPPRG